MNSSRSGNGSKPAPQHLGHACLFAEEVKCSTDSPLRPPFLSLKVPSTAGGLQVIAVISSSNSGGGNQSQCVERMPLYQNDLWKSLRSAIKWSTYDYWIESRPAQYLEQCQEQCLVNASSSEVQKSHAWTGAFRVSCLLGDPIPHGEQGRMYNPDGFLLTWRVYAILLIYQISMPWVLLYLLKES